MRIHLVTYATSIFLLRRWFLQTSGLAAKVVDETVGWDPKRLLEAGFDKRAPMISLNSRGSGFWAWKPFIIEHQLSLIPDGDIVLYCDVGRRNNFKLLNRSIDPLIKWMDEKQQDVLPGLLIPWKGPMSMWTKRDAFVFTQMDTLEAHTAIPIQASFSLWRAGPSSRQFAAKWMDLCAQARLISDDKGVSGLPELPDFTDHRHDQSLLTLCCLQSGIKGIDLGDKIPPIDTQHPCEVAHWLQPSVTAKGNLSTSIVEFAARPLGLIEKAVRKCIKIG